MDTVLRKFLQRGDLSRLTTYQAGIIQAAAHRRLQKISDDILEPYGITKTQWLIIGAVRDAGTPGARITDLAALLGTTLAFLTNTIHALELKKMLMRSQHESDNRAKLVSLVPAFQPQCAVIEEALREGLRCRIYSDIDPSDFRTYLKVLYGLSNADALLRSTIY